MDVIRAVMPRVAQGRSENGTGKGSISTNRAALKEFVASLKVAKARNAKVWTGRRTGLMIDDARVTKNSDGLDNIDSFWNSAQLDEERDGDEVSTPGTGSMGESTPGSGNSPAASPESPMSLSWTGSGLLEVAGGVDDGNGEARESGGRGGIGVANLRDGENRGMDDAEGTSLLAKRLEFPPVKAMPSPARSTARSDLSTDEEMGEGGFEHDDGGGGGNAEEHGGGEGPIPSEERKQEHEEGEEHEGGHRASVDRSIAANDAPRLRAASPAVPTPAAAPASIPDPPAADPADAAGGKGESSPPLPGNLSRDLPASGSVPVVGARAERKSVAPNEPPLPTLPTMPTNRGSGGNTARSKKSIADGAAKARVQDKRKDGDNDPGMVEPAPSSTVGGAAEGKRRAAAVEAGGAGGSAFAQNTDGCDTQTRPGERRVSGRPGAGRRSRSSTFQEELPGGDKVAAGQEPGVRRSSASSSFSAGRVDIGGGGWADEDVGGADDLIPAGSESDPRKGSTSSKPPAAESRKSKAASKQPISGAKSVGKRLPSSRSTPQDPPPAPKAPATAKAASTRGSGGGRTGTGAQMRSTQGSHAGAASTRRKSSASADASTTPPAPGTGADADAEVDDDDDDDGARDVAAASRDVSPRFESPRRSPRGDGSGSRPRRSVETTATPSGASGRGGGVRNGSTAGRRKDKKVIPKVPQKKSASREQGTGRKSPEDQEVGDEESPVPGSRLNAKGKRRARRISHEEEEEEEEEKEEKKERENEGGSEEQKVRRGSRGKSASPIETPARWKGKRKSTTPSSGDTERHEEEDDDDDDERDEVDGGDSGVKSSGAKDARRGGAAGGAPETTPAADVEAPATARKKRRGVIARLSMGSVSGRGGGGLGGDSDGDPGIKKKKEKKKQKQAKGTPGPPRKSTSQFVNMSEVAGEE